MPLSALHVARTGLEAQDARMRVIAHNLANIGTTAFKRERASFATLAYQDNRVAGQRASGDAAYAIGINFGSGVALQGTSRIAVQGALEGTGNALDVALDGDGFFQVTLADGSAAFTRAGNLTLTAQGEVVTAHGHALDPPISVPAGAGSLTVAADGTVTAVVPGSSEPQQLGQILVARFANSAGLRAGGDNLLFETAASGPPDAGPPGSEGRGAVRQGMLETSNVNVVEEMVAMIEAQRAYEISTKMVRAVDDMLRNANQAL
ncbi:flagellar basal-body rod protein FlgG [Erythrobacteraceae bacterium CFH 75059]|uniref:flagellar basal-body rod protein FlgG n=1 Tax=Qipengyuania thermophila TaxID=2509361 RepID=UPI00101E9CC4|nr:flagellar basal-body rod protein FlgG [Qipengyuania thermophila]TCD06288.1 flagellar basal-body rod protein FlgG [Erythrobacteraceae bacterium CFH 75059]